MIQWSCLLRGMESKLYVSLGLPLDTWRLIDEAKNSRIISEVLGRYPTTSDVVHLLVRYGTAHMRVLEEQDERQATLVARSQGAER